MNFIQAVLTIKSQTERVFVVKIENARFCLKYFFLVNHCLLCFYCILRKKVNGVLYKKAPSESVSHLNVLLCYQVSYSFQRISTNFASVWLVVLCLVPKQKSENSRNIFTVFFNSVMQLLWQF